MEPTQLNKALPEKTNSNRRGLLKSILGAGFAAPVIATFSMDSLLGQTAAGPSGAVTAANTTSSPSRTTTSISPAACSTAQVKLDKNVLANAGYTAASPYFHAHASDMSFKQDYLNKRNQPIIVTSCTPAPPCRVTISVAFELEPNGASVGSIRVTHYARPDLSVTSSQITKDGQKLCDIAFPYGKIIPTSMVKYNDLNALLEDMGAGEATVEIAGTFQGVAFTLVGDIKPVPQPYRPMVFTS